MELGPEDVSLLERCPHFRGWYLQTSHFSSDQYQWDGMFDRRQTNQSRKTRGSVFEFYCQSFHVTSDQSDLVLKRCLMEVT